MNRLLVAAAVVAVVAAPAAFAAKAPPPASLTGEILTPTTIETVASCEADGSGRFTYVIEGVATGPYPGTFTTSGTIVIEPGGTIASITANFRIDSPAGTVTGTQRLRSGGLSGYCFDSPTGDRAVGIARTFYDARIEFDGRTYRDEGRAIGEFLGGAGAPFEAFTQVFFSSLTAVVEVKPGKGCGDTNHEHEREEECKKRAA